VVIIGGAKPETKEPLVTALSPVASSILVGGKIAGDLVNASNLPPNVDIAQLTADGRDITEASARRFAQKIMAAQTVIWNGTMGIFEEPAHQLGTEIIAQAVNQTAGFTLVGGGDTEAALTKLNLQSGIDHISTGGGAMLTYLSTHSLVAVSALTA
jgi:3-phosphoglycerate kinase